MKSYRGASVPIELSCELTAELKALARDEDATLFMVLLAGFAATSAPYIVTMDADLSHRPVFLEEFWRRRDEAEVLIASRYVHGGRADMSRFRRLLSHILNRTYSRVLSFPLRDLSSGFRM